MISYPWVLRGKKLRISFAIALCAVGFLWPWHLLSDTTPETYRLQVDFESANPKIVQEIDLDVVLGVPFTARTQDSYTNHCTVTGTLLKVNETTFQIKLGKIECKRQGFALGVPGRDPLYIHLGGDGYGAHGIGGAEEGYRVRLTKN
jgi:hypothetical protein